MGKSRGISWSLKAAIAAFGVVLAQGAAPAMAATYSYQLSNPQLQHLFPNAADTTMPSFYAGQSGFPQTLEQSILLYTKQSLDNDGIKGNDGAANICGLIGAIAVLVGLFGGSSTFRLILVGVVLLIA